MPISCTHNYIAQKICNVNFVVTNMTNLIVNNIQLHKVAKWLVTYDKISSSDAVLDLNETIWTTNNPKFK